MSKAPSPLLGYNNNVRHKNRVFHIQTEDSGVKYGHIITHLFMDGGRILKSVKTSYQEYLSNEKLADIIREMMKQQHKAMFIALRDGKFDHLVEGKGEPPPKAAPAEAPEPAREAPPASGSATKKKPASGPPKKVQTPTRVAAVPEMHKGVRVDPDSFEDEPKTVRNADPLTLDIDALERAAAAADSHSGSFKPAGDLPPPPTNLFREKSATGSYRTVKPTAPTDATNPSQASRPPPPPSNRRPASAPPRTPAPRAAPSSKRSPSPPPQAPRASPTVRPVPRNQPPGPASERRYAPTRPASIFGQARPQQGKGIFGEDLISDKSLDEVILSYLADDLEPPPAEKNAKKK